MTVARSATMTKSPTKKTLSQVTTVLHRVLRVDRSSFSFSAVQFVYIQGVLLDWVVRPCTDLCSKPVLKE